MYFDSLPKSHKMSVKVLVMMVVVVFSTTNLKVWWGGKRTTATSFGKLEGRWINIHNLADPRKLSAKLAILIQECIRILAPLELGMKEMLE